MATPRFVKKVMRSTPAQWLLAAGIASYFKLVQRTSRIDCPARPVEGAHILALWHGRLIMLPLFRHEPRALIALISAHRDGQIISKAARLFGIRTATGSSTRGGARAARELIRFAREGHSLFVTPDGPRGPRMRADAGIIDLARLTKLPIVPAAMSAARGRLLGTWDRFFLPSPFTRVAVRWGAPITVTGDDDREARRAELEAALIAVQDEADRACGRASVPPAERL